MSAHYTSTYQKTIIEDRSRLSPNPNRPSRSPQRSRSPYYRSTQEQITRSPIKRMVESSTTYITTDKDAKTIARRIFSHYDRERSGNLETEPLRNMLIDAYKGISDNMMPTPTHINNYLKIHDRNGDGMVTLEDMEKSVMKYLVHDGLADANNPGGVTYSTRYEPYISTYTTHQTNRLTQNRDTFGVQSNVNNNQGSHSSINYNSSYTPYVEKKVERTTYKSDIGDYNITSNLNKNSVKEQMLRSQTRTFSKEIVDAELLHAKKVFEKYDLNRNGYQEFEEVIPMLRDTYKVMGNQYEPTNTDVTKYIEMMDQDFDGKISQEEYEIFVLKALQNRGINM